MVYVDALVHEHFGHIFTFTLLAPDLIEGGGIFVLVDRPRQAELTVGRHAVLFAPVDDLQEVDGDFGELDVGVGAAAVDHRGELGGSGLLSAEAEHEEHRVDHVRLAASVRADDAGETLVKGSQNLEIKINTKGVD